MVQTANHIFAPIMFAALLRNKIAFTMPAR